MKRTKDARVPDRWKKMLKCSGAGCPHAQLVYVLPGRKAWVCSVCGRVNYI